MSRPIPSPEEAAARMADYLRRATSSDLAEMGLAISAGPMATTAEGRLLKAAIEAELSSREVTPHNP